MVLILHSAIPYLLYPLPGLAWPVRHPHPSWAIDRLFWLVELTVMPLFFALSGLVAEESLYRRGPRDFIEGRARRLALPLMAACVVVLPLDLYLWILGWVGSGELAWVKLRSLKLPPPYDRAWGLGHLWYLQYLIVLSLGLVGWKTWGRPLLSRLGVRRPDALGRNVRSLFTATASGGIWRIPAETFLLAAAVLYASPQVVIGFQHSFWPVVPKLLHAAVFFGLGCRLSACRRTLAADFTQGLSRDGEGTQGDNTCLPPLRRGGWGGRGSASDQAKQLPSLTLPARGGEGLGPVRGWVRSAVFLVLAAAAYLAATAMIDRERSGAVQVLWHRPLLAVAMAASTTITVWGLMLWAIDGESSQHQTPEWVGAIARATFWVYLVHVPLVGLIQIDLRTTGWPAEGQFAAVFAGALAISLASYRFAVRGTALERFLEGRLALSCSLAGWLPRGVRPGLRSDELNHACLPGSRVSL